VENEAAGFSVTIFESTQFHIW